MIAVSSGRACVWGRPKRIAAKSYEGGECQESRQQPERWAAELRRDHERTSARPAIEFIRERILASDPGRFQLRSAACASRFRFHPPRSTSFDVVTLGLNSIDLVAVVAEYPASNSKQRLQRFARLPGGQMATASAVCARLGWRASYIGVFGDDDLGRLSRESLTSEGVDVSRVVERLPARRISLPSFSSTRAPANGRCCGIGIPH